MLVEKIEAVNPMKVQVNEIKRFLEVDTLMLFNFHLNIKDEVSAILNETFYNHNVLNMFDNETYEQMRVLANHKFGLNLINVYLPSQSVNQGSFDAIQIMKNISSFVTRYSYDMYTQSFIQMPSESKVITTIGIEQITDSLKTHGTGVLNTFVNQIYIFIRK